MGYLEELKCGAPLRRSFFYDVRQAWQVCGGATAARTQ